MVQDLCPHPSHQYSARSADSIFSVIRRTLHPLYRPDWVRRRLRPDQYRWPKTQPHGHHSVHKPRKHDAGASVRHNCCTHSDWRQPDHHAHDDCYDVISILCFVEQPCLNPDNYGAPCPFCSINALRINRSLQNPQTTSFAKTAKKYSYILN